MSESQKVGRPTQSDVAKRAGVSPSVVSAVVSGRAEGKIRISDGTRKRVWDAIDALGYVINPIARRLAGGQANVIGVFTYEPIFPFATRSIYFPALVGMESEAELRGYDLILFTGQSGTEGRRIFDANGGNRLGMADGVIILGFHQRNDELARICSSGFPVVLMGRRELPEGVEPSYVTGDYKPATSSLVKRLTALGHRRLLYVGNAEAREPMVDREAGFWAASQELDGQIDEARVIRPKAVTQAMVRNWVEDGFTGVLFEGDERIAEAEIGCNALGLKIPRDFSFLLLGISEEVHKTRWTGFVTPQYEMGSQSIALLIDILQNGSKPPRRALIPCPYCAGDTLAQRPEPDTRTRHLSHKREE